MHSRTKKTTKIPDISTPIKFLIRPYCCSEKGKEILIFNFFLDVVSYCGIHIIISLATKAHQQHIQSSCTHSRNEFSHLETKGFITCHIKTQFRVGARFFNESLLPLTLPCSIVLPDKTNGQLGNLHKRNLSYFKRDVYKGLSGIF